MTGPEGNSEFCFSRISMFPEMKSRETLRLEGNKIQILNKALRFQQQRQHFAGNSELFPI